MGVAKKGQFYQYFWKLLPYFTRLNQLCKDTRNMEQESWAITKMTARCAL